MAELNREGGSFLSGVCICSLISVVSPFIPSSLSCRDSSTLQVFLEHLLRAGPLHS